LFICFVTFGYKRINNKQRSVYNFGLLFIRSFQQIIKRVFNKILTLFCLNYLEKKNNNLIYLTF
jgi:hypothetical protein